jgi:hypothetical protein
MELLERYPELQFLLHYTPFEQGSLPLSEIVEVDLEKIELLYVYGLGRSDPPLRQWLEEKNSRRLIFLEDDLAAIDAGLHSSDAAFLFSHSQVHIHFLSSEKKIDQHLTEVADIYPSDQIEIVASCLYQKKKKVRFQQIRLKLLRKSAVAQAILTESLYSHRMLVNVLRNIKQWHGSFLAGGLKGKFQGIPALICGAGPSLQQTIPHLKELKDRALLIAGGSTIAALSNQGIHPHLGVALDPNAEEFGRLKIASSFEMPLLYGTRLQPDVLNALNGERGYLVTATGGPCEHYFEKGMQITEDPIGPELGAEALSVTTICIALAVEMGCNPILLDGIDLAYTGMRRYAEGILPSSTVQLGDLKLEKKALERLLKRKNIQGHYVHTLVKWVMESECIAAYARAHPNVRFINLSSASLGFPGIPNVPIKEVMEKELVSSLDLSALVHAEIQQLKMPPLKEKIGQEMRAVHESLLRLSAIADQMLEELERAKTLEESSLPTGKMTILEIDFQEERAFECLFPLLGPSLDRLLSRAFFPTPIESKTAKWQHWKEVIESEIATFQDIAGGAAHKGSSAHPLASTQAKESVLCV